MVQAIMFTHCNSGPWTVCVQRILKLQSKQSKGTLQCRASAVTRFSLTDMVFAQAPVQHQSKLEETCTS